MTRTFDQLSESEQESAVNIALQRLVEAVCEGAIRFNDAANRDDLQARIDAAWEEMEKLRTPWFIGERLMEDPYVKTMLTGMAQCDAEDTEYRTKEDPIVVTLA